MIIISAGRIAISMNNIFRKFLIVALSLAAAGTSSGYSAKDISKADYTDDVVDFEHNLDDYVPAKTNYNFYFTYKIVHPWWDAVALGMEDAQKKYLEKGIVITYEYMAPDCKRIAYVGNTHNYQDGADLTEALCEKTWIQRQGRYTRWKLRSSLS